MCPSSMQYPTLQFGLVQSQFLIRCHWATMAKAQSKDSVLELVIPFMHKGVNPKGLVISKIKCKAAQKYLLQFDSFSFETGCSTLHLYHQ